MPRYQSCHPLPGGHGLSSNYLPLNYSVVPQAHVAGPSLCTHLPKARYALEAEPGATKSPGLGMTAACSGSHERTVPLWPLRLEKHHQPHRALPKPSPQSFREEKLFPVGQGLRNHQSSSCLASAQTSPLPGSLLGPP